MVVNNYEEVEFVQLNDEYIKHLISLMGFTPQNGKNNVFYKAYSLHDGYVILVDFNIEKIDYCDTSKDLESRIRLGDATTSNFAKAENFVVLECVNRLLEKGYSPSCIELEKTYPSGRGHSGNLDILVNNQDGTPFLMIECKTWGKEYEKEYKKMLKDGGQLFTYFKLATASKHLCLYTSHLLSDTIEYISSIVDVQSEWAGLSEAKDIYEYWNKMFKDNGVFEVYAFPYNIVHKKLTRGDLKNMREEDSGKIFNQIMEILRHNGISDKPNAFNKLLNLFVCKIIDEDKNDDEELEFQYWEGMTDEELQMTLNDLYKKGMWRFLNINVIDHETDDVKQKLGGFGNTDEILRIFIDLRLKKSPNFAFVEVLDDRTFKLNAKVVREIVELLQGYRFRYEQKHEFLGNFFELLLNTSMKQEAGQYFTPIPITRFMISALPLKHFVQDKIISKAGDPLPTVIDYACGSGHFLTEFMAQLQDIIDVVDISKASPSVKKLISSWRDNVKFSWAKDYVYGIDFDNRLVKTTKVSAFFNGDGEATIVWGNGLDNFEHSEEYRGKLKHVTQAGSKDNGQFDILISNPPYSVQAFRSMLGYGKETFYLFNSLTDNSSEIECLFVERMKQLLKVGGWAAVILPSSMLSNGGIYSRTREIIFKYFYVKAIVELGSGTFMKTGTNTIILFLERRADGEHEDIACAIDTFFNNRRDVTVAGIERAFSKFVASVYDDLTFDDYLSLISGNASDGMKSHELWRDYAKEFGDLLYTKALEVEREKLFYFLLTYKQNIVLVKSGQKQAEKAFLGYEFSERRGYEGIKHLPGGSMLFDDNGDVQNLSKVNSYIYNAFLGKPASEVDEALSGHVSYGRMSGFFEYGTRKFDKRVNLKNKSRDIFNSIYPQEKLGDGLVILYDHLRRPVSKIYRTRGQYPYYGATGIIDYVDEYIFDGRYVLIGEDGAKWGSNENSAFIVNGKCWINNHVHVMQANTDLLMDAYLVCILNKLDLSYYITGDVNVPKLNQNNLLSIKIPIPPLDIQREIVAEFEKLESEEASCKMAVRNLKRLLLNSDYFSFNQQRIGDIAIMVKRGKSAKYGDSAIQIIKSGQARGYLDFDFSQRYYVAASFVSDERNLIKGDVLINSTGVGTAGRVTLFNLDGSYVVDSHITIVRLDTKKALPKYVLYALANIGFKNIENMATGQSGQIEISLDIVNDIRIPLPPLERQQEIVAQIEQHEAEIVRLSQRIDELIALKTGILERYL